jgi:peptidylprolyl isomerase
MNGDLIVALHVGMALLGGPPSPRAVSAPAEASLVPFQISETIRGTGSGARDGDRITVDFTITTVDGKELANSQRRGLPFTLVLGDPNVSPFWWPALKGARKGCERQLTFSSDVVFGPEGAPPFVPHGAQLFGTIRVLHVIRAERQQVASLTVAPVGRG